jgi:hypothetical protein
MSKIDATGVLKVRLEMKRKCLVSDMRRLAGDLMIEADKLESNPSRSPNPLGEIQGRGNSIDALCGEVGAMEGAIRTLETNGEYGCDCQKCEDYMEWQREKISMSQEINKLRESNSRLVAKLRLHLAFIQDGKFKCHDGEAILNLSEITKLVGQESMRGDK